MRDIGKMIEDMDMVMNTLVLVQPTSVTIQITNLMVDKISISGMGKYNWPNGEVYEGEWSNGTKHGNGMWIGIKKDKYVGEW